MIYQAKSGAIALRGDISHETIWAAQAQIAEVFQAERSVITKHIRNILKDSVCANFAHCMTQQQFIQQKRKVICTEPEEFLRENKSDLAALSFTSIILCGKCKR